ncbi:MAG TPA: hypothetical protein VGU90_05935, partial [Terriglobales bacterium]|nr:hypothetical protein [Terriglobales bacterium]
ALFDIGEGSGARSSAVRITAEFASKARARRRDLLIVISCDSKYHEGSGGYAASKLIPLWRLGGAISQPQPTLYTMQQLWNL